MQHRRDQNESLAPSGEAEKYLMSVQVERPLLFGNLHQLPDRKHVEQLFRSDVRPGTRVQMGRL